MMRAKIADLMKSHYDLTVHSLTEVPAGWSAAALKAGTNRGDYFVKVYDRARPSTRVWVDRLDTWLPVAQWLAENTPLAAHMSAPIRATDGAIRIEDGNLILLVYPFIPGETLCETRLTAEQARSLGCITGLLHAYGSEIPVPTADLTEQYDFPFCDSLPAALDAIENGSLREIVAPHAPLLIDRSAELRERADQLKRANPRKVLCHTDIHGWNLIQSERLILVDWEGLLLAPPEADLFSFTDSFFFGYAWDGVMSAYRAVRPDFRLDGDALPLYRLRRRLEDIAAFIESIRKDDLTSDALAHSAALLRRECGLLRAT